MAITVAQIRSKFPEFKDCDQGIADLAIAEADANVNATAWGVRADDGRIYLAAHLLKLARAGDSLPGGPLAQVKIGDASAQYAAPRISGPEALTVGTLFRTVYGMRYMELRRQIFASRVI